MKWNKNIVITLSLHHVRSCFLREVLAHASFDLSGIEITFNHRLSQVHRNKHKLKPQIMMLPPEIKQTGYI